MAPFAALGAIRWRIFCVFGFRFSGVFSVLGEGFGEGMRDDGSATRRKAAPRVGSPPV